MRATEGGFSLIETLIATTIVIVALSGLAQLFVVSAAANVGAKAATTATILAQDKMEELIATAENGGDDSDFMDSRGRLLGTGGVPPAGTAYVRRWTIQPLPESSTGPFAFQVFVSRVAAGDEAARIVAIRTRRTP